MVTLEFRAFGKDGDGKSSSGKGDQGEDRGAEDGFCRSKCRWPAGSQAAQIAAQPARAAQAGRGRVA